MHIYHVCIYVKETLISTLMDKHSIFLYPNLFNLSPSTLVCVYLCVCMYTLVYLFGLWFLDLTPKRMISKCKFMYF